MPAEHLRKRRPSDDYLTMLQSQATYGLRRRTAAPGNGACSGQQAPSAAGTTGNQVAMNFDLNACENLGPGLYRCPGSDKPICDPGYNKGDVECLKVDKNGVLIRERMWCRILPAADAWVGLRSKRCVQ